MRTQPEVLALEDHDNRLAERGRDVRCAGIDCDDDARLGQNGDPMQERKIAQPGDVCCSHPLANEHRMSFGVRPVGDQDVRVLLRERADEPAHSIRAEVP